MSYAEIEWYDPRLSRRKRAELILQAYKETRRRRKLDGFDVSTLSSSSSDSEIKEKRSSNNADNDDFKFGKDENSAEKFTEE